MHTVHLANGQSLDMGSAPTALESKKKNAKGKFETHSRFFVRVFGTSLKDTEPKDIEVVPLKGPPGSFHWAEVGQHNDKPRRGHRVVTNFGTELITGYEVLKSAVRDGVYCVTTHLGEMWVQRLGPSIWQEAPRAA